MKFGVTYKESEQSQEDEVIKTLKKVNCHLLPHDATIECSKPGLCKNDMFSSKGPYV